MRELVYLSDAKLAQFIPDRSPWWTRLRRRNAKVEVGAATVKFGLDIGEPVDPSRATKLDAVVAEIEKSAKWFGDRTVRPGQWVQFEVPMNYDNMVWMVREYQVLNPEPFKPGERPLLFIDCPGAGADGGGRLLLHGSEQHLVGRGGAPGQFELRDVPGYSSFPPGHLLASAHVYRPARQTAEEPVRLSGWDPHSRGPSGPTTRTGNRITARRLRPDNGSVRQ